MNNDSNSHAEEFSLDENILTKLNYNEHCIVKIISLFLSRSKILFSINDHLNENYDLIKILLFNEKRDQ
jgi:hypothetical protein